MGKIAITGASGFIGSHLVKRLCEKELLLIERKHRGQYESDFFIGDLSPNTNYLDSLDGCETIIHTAARVHMMHESQSAAIEQYRLVNTLGTINLAEQAIAAGVKRFIFISSVKVNGEQTKTDEPFNELDQPEPSDPYGISKLEAEKQLMELAINSNMEVVVIRPTLVYGPGVKANFASLMNLVSKGIPLPFGCITNNKRSLVLVDNLVDLIVTCIDHPKAANQVFLVSDDHDVSTSEMVRQMANAIGKPIWQLPVPVWCYKLAGKVFKKSDMVERLTGSLQVDISHAKETLGWTPPKTLQEGFKHTVEAFLQSKK